MCFNNLLAFEGTPRCFSSGNKIWMFKSIIIKMYFAVEVGILKMYLGRGNLLLKLSSSGDSRSRSFWPLSDSGWVHLKALVHFVISTITLHFRVHKMLLRLLFDRDRNLDFTAQTVEEAKIKFAFSFSPKMIKWLEAGCVTMSKTADTSPL